jgi:hypothetical protein
VLGTVGLAVTGTPAFACQPNPYVDMCGSNPTVSGTPWTSNGVNVRYQPAEWASRVAGLAYGQRGTVECWAHGLSGSAFVYWDYTVVGGHAGYIADACLNTGGTITGQVRQCRAELVGY